MKITLEWKDDINDIDDCEKGKIIALDFYNGEMYTGIYEGRDDNEIYLKSMDGKTSLGLPFNMIRNYAEQV